MTAPVLVVYRYATQSARGLPRKDGWLTHNVSTNVGRKRDPGLSHDPDHDSLRATIDNQNPPNAEAVLQAPRVGSLAQSVAEVPFYASRVPLGIYSTCCATRGIRDASGNAAIVVITGT